MTLRALALRVAVLLALVPTAVATHIVGAKSELPFALLESFDRAFALAYDAAERQVAALEATRPRLPAGPDVLSLLGELEGIITAACDAAGARLDVELAVAGSLSLERRNAALGCLERHLDAARRSMRETADPRVRAEYAITCERLREVRQLI
ncbi:MAG TPA: hypothetical protein VLM79_06240 [Kofleriaceae bacterium]|nr:hypothetical protein [Kofleriaceae bacterium]